MAERAFARKQQNLYVQDEYVDANIILGSLSKVEKL